MAFAFHDDEQLKFDLLSAIDSHIAGGTLKIGVTRWDGVSGSPLGVSVQGTDATDYADRFGYPVALAALLDPFTSKLGENDFTIRFVRSWVEVVKPGVDLTFVPLEILNRFLRKSSAGESFPDVLVQLLELQTASLGGEATSRSSWSELRKEIEEQSIAAKNRAHFHLMLLEAAAWPLSSSQSVLPEVTRLWMDFGAVGPVPGWDSALAKKLHDLIGQVYPEARELSKNGSPVTGEELLHQRYPDLAAKGDEMLAAKARVEREHREEAAAMVLDVLKKVPERPAH